MDVVVPAARSTSKSEIMAFEEVVTHRVSELIVPTMQVWVQCMYVHGAAQIHWVASEVEQIMTKRAEN